MTDLIRPLLDGQSPICTGSLVISPGQNAALQFGAQKLLFSFLEGIGPFGVDVTPAGNDFEILVRNASAIGAAFELKGLKLNGISVRLNLILYAIGADAPHRLIHYTASY